MTRGRKPAPAAESVPDEMDHAGAAAKSQALTELGQRSAEISERYGDGQPYDRARAVSQARFYMAASAEAMLELGKQLIQMKEYEPYGDFLEIVTEQLKMSPRAAQLMMRAAAKFLSPALAQMRKQFAHLDRAKLYDLMAEADEELEQLAAGGTLAGHTLDDMQAMSARELRAALVDSRKVAAAKDRVIAKKDAKLNQLAEEAELRGGLGADERATLEALDRGVAGADIAIAQLAKAVAAAIDSGTLPPAVHERARQAAEYVGHRMARVLLEAGVALDLQAEVEPIYLIGGGDAHAKAGQRRAGKRNGAN